MMLKISPDNLTANPLRDVDFDNPVLLRVFPVVQREGNCQVEDDGHKVAKAEGAVLPHVPQNDDAQDLARQSEPNLQECVSESFCPQNTCLLLRVRSENSLPHLQADDEVFEL